MFKFEGLKVNSRDDRQNDNLSTQLSPPTLKRGETNDNREIKMKEEQLNLKTIAQIFGFFPDSVFLINECNDATETADETGIFYQEKSVKYEVYGESIVTPALLPPVLKVPGTPTISNSARAPPKGVSKKNKMPSKTHWCFQGARMD